MKWVRVARANREVLDRSWRETISEELQNLDSFTVLSRFSEGELYHAVFGVKNPAVYLERLDGVFGTLEFLGLKIVDKDSKGMRFETAMTAFDSYAYDQRGKGTPLTVERLKEFLRGEDRDVPKATPPSPSTRQTPSEPLAMSAGPSAGLSSKPRSKRPGGGCFGWNFDSGGCRLAGGTLADHEKKHPHKCLRCNQAHRLIECVCKLTIVKQAHQWTSVYIR